MISNDYPHIQFKRCWVLTEQSNQLIGECEAYINAISHLPILPEEYKKLLRVSLNKGALSTTAIEGNTLTEDDLVRIQAGENMPPSKEYLQKEVTNILDAFTQIRDDVVLNNKSGFITEPLICAFHKAVGKDLGEAFQAIPGKYRECPVVVGTYKAPPHELIPQYMGELCYWLKKEFGYGMGNQKIGSKIVQAIVTHVFIEWIHPFSDGNGRTGRLVEFYILLRGGLPDITSHILSNHYNETRTSYYNHIQNATKKSDITDFLGYALLGFRDGLKMTFQSIQDALTLITWKKLVYDKIEALNITHRDVRKRRRSLLLDMNPFQIYKWNEIQFGISPRVTSYYSKLGSRQIQRDIQELVAAELLLVVEPNKYQANINLVHKALRKIDKPDMN